MPFLTLQWTAHARAKMNHYRLSPARVRRVLHSPKRVEEGVAPKTVAMMQPTSLKTFRRDIVPAKAGIPAKSGQTWTQEIWVMVEDTAKSRKVISAWRYPGVSKPRSSVVLAVAREEYREFTKKKKI